MKSHDLGTCRWQIKTRKTTKDLVSHLQEDLQAMAINWRTAKRDVSDRT